MTRYVQATLTRKSADLEAARAQSPDHFFPSRLSEQLVLEWAMSQPGEDPLAAYALGNYCYDLKRHQEALDLWDLTVAYAKINRLYELKTPKTDEDMAHIATVFTPYFEAREWESREKPAR